MQSGGTQDRGVNIVSVPTKSGQLATMQMLIDRQTDSRACALRVNNEMTIYSVQQSSVSLDG